LGVEKGSLLVRRKTTVPGTSELSPRKKMGGGEMDCSEEGALTNYKLKKSLGRGPVFGKSDEEYLQEGAELCLERRKKVPSIDCLELKGDNRRKGHAAKGAKKASLRKMSQ